MALTAPRGFSGGPMADIDYGIGAAGGAWVESAAALAVTQPSSSVRTVSVAAGNCDAFGIRVTNDAALAQSITAPGSGGAWYLITVRFNWSAKTATLQALAGPTTGATTAPTGTPATLPATIQTAPGTQFDLPLAWVWASSATSTLTLFDVRMRTLQNEAFASTPAALVLFAQQFAPVAGMQVPSISDGITYRWNGTAWKPWDSDWISFNTVTNGFFIEVETWTSRYRYRSGRVLQELAGKIIAIQTGNFSMTQPVPADAAIYPPAGRAIFASLDGSFLLDANVMGVAGFTLFGQLAQTNPQRTYFLTSSSGIDVNWTVRIAYEYDPA